MRKPTYLFERLCNYLHVSHASKQQRVVNADGTARLFMGRVQAEPLWVELF